MNKIGLFLLSLLFFMAAGMSQTGYADPEAEDAGSGITLRNEAPIYSGQVQEGDLEELTASDFEVFGNPAETPAEQYRQYQKALEQSTPGILVPYKTKVDSDDLAADDFHGFGVTEDLAETRYQAYLNMAPVSVEGREAHYVYVYHSPLGRT